MRKEFRANDVVKWEEPKNQFESEDVMVVETTRGMYLEVFHINEDGYGAADTVAMEDVVRLGTIDPYDRPEEIFEKYRNE